MVALQVSFMVVGTERVFMKDMHTLFSKLLRLMDRDLSWSGILGVKENGMVLGVRYQSSKCTLTTMLTSTGDGSKEWTPEWMQKLDHRFGDDGAFWMSYDDLLKKYQTFDRTRLFTDEWKVTQQWTSLRVPWTVGYQDTEFHFTLDKPAAVVMVLSQLDQRYFCGLEGQYSFELSFRVHKAGEENYIVRSHGNYWMRRSVTAELELEAGEYHVLMKVEAEKSDYGFAVENVIRTNARSRRDKLMRIGLAYDMAMAKGKIVETEDEKKARKSYEAKQKAKAKKEMKDKLMKEKKKRRHNENKELRKQRAANVKRKEKQKARDEKRKAKEAEAKAAEARKTEVTGEQKEDVKPEGSSEVEKPLGESKEIAPAATSETKKPEEIASKDEAKVETQPTTKTEVPEGLKSEVKEEPREETSKPESATNKTNKAPEPTSSLPPPPVLSDPNAPLPFDDDEDDLSDLESVVSDISSGAISDAILDAKLLADAALPLPPMPNEDEEDEFEKDPWNAVAVVGLRVYCKGSGVRVKVVRPKEWDLDGEGKLDVDDSAADATKDVVEVIEEEKREEKKREESAAAGEEEGEKKSEGESEGRVVVV